MRFDVADLVLCFDQKRVFNLLSLDLGEEVDERGWVYRPVVARIPFTTRPLHPNPGYVVHDTRTRRVVLEFHAMRVWRFADQDEVTIEGQVLVDARGAAN